MRVISGTCRGLRLNAVPGNNTRPTTDRVKEAMFSILAPYLGEGDVLDLFAGTGALGIESLSRGMDHCVFVDQAPRAIEVIRSNLAACGLVERSAVLRMDAKRALRHLAEQGRQFMLVFLDPPYQEQLGPRFVREIQQHHLHREQTVYVVEHSSTDELPEDIQGACLFRQSRYGDITLSFFKEGNG